MRSIAEWWIYGEVDWERYAELLRQWGPLLAGALYGAGQRGGHHPGWAPHCLLPLIAGLQSTQLTLLLVYPVRGVCCESFKARPWEPGRKPPVFPHTARRPGCRLVVLGRRSRL